MNKLKFLLFSILIFAGAAAGQTPLSRTCAGANPATKQAKVEIDRAGNVQIVTCENKKLFVNNVQLSTSTAAAETAAATATAAANTATVAANAAATTAATALTAAQSATATAAGIPLRDTTTAITLEALVAAIGTNKTTISLTGNVYCSTPVTIPSNVFIESLGGLILKQTGCTITFAGYGLKNPMSPQGVFGGFINRGEIVFSNAFFYPKQLYAGVFVNSAAVNINLADAALLGKSAEIFAPPGNLTERVILTEKHHLKLLAGTFQNNVGVPYLATFQLASNTKVTGAGIGLTIVRETSSNAIQALGLFYASSAQGLPGVSTNENITISDLTILGADNQPINQAQSAILLGNVTNGIIERVHIKGVHGFGAYVGGDILATAKNCFIRDSIFEGIGTQNVGTINSDGLTITGNQFVRGGEVGQYNYSYYIDLEPNGNGQLKNIIVSNNIFNGYRTIYDRSLHAIRINAAGIADARNIIVSNNLIKGIDLGNGNTDEGFLTAITLEGLENVFITGNLIQGAKQNGISAVDCASVHVSNNVLSSVGRFYGNPAMVLEGVANSVVRDNTFGLTRTNTEAENPQNSSFSKLIEERPLFAGATVATTGGVTTVTLTEDKKVFEWWVGKTITLNIGGQPSVDYTILTIDFPTRSFTISGNAGNHSSAGIGTKFGTNRYVDNLDASYSLQPGSTSQIRNIIF